MSITVAGTAEQSSRAEVPAVLGRLRQILESGEFARLVEVYAPEALLDANVPTWRFQRQGHEAIVQQFHGWYSGPMPLVGWRERPTGWGAVVELEERQGEREEEVYSRSVHLFVTAGDQIAEHVVYCTGVWDADGLAHHRAHAPMIRW